MKSETHLGWVWVCLAVVCVTVAGCTASSDSGQPVDSGGGGSVSEGGTDGGGGSSGASDSGSGQSGGGGTADSGSSQDGTSGGGSAATFTLSSPAFASGAPIPLQYASTYAGGGDVTPPLRWSGVPAGTVELALIMTDPDAFGFVHWIIYKIPATAGGLPAGIPSGESVSNPAGALQGVNSGPGDAGYYGPEPPPGETHTYHFTLYALDTSLSVGGGIDQYALRDAMEGHILAQTELLGTFAQ
jgi:Raf kinase inhibitor-like YbhB/YbcL family protein